MSILEGFFPIIVYPLSDGQPVPNPNPTRAGRNMLIPTPTESKNMPAVIAQTMYGAWFLLGLSVLLFYFSPFLGTIGVLLAAMLLFLNHLHQQNKNINLPFSIPKMDKVQGKIRAALQKVEMPTMTLKRVTWSLVILLLCISFFCYPKLTLAYIGIGLFFLVKDGTVFKKSPSFPIPNIERTTTSEKTKTRPVAPPVILPTPAPKKVVKPKVTEKVVIPVEPEPNFPMGNEPSFPTSNVENPALPSPEEGDFKTILATVIAKTVSATIPYESIKGQSEEDFYNVLTLAFPDRIFRDLIIEPFDGKQPYIPDMIFKHRATNLHIDIEVDEPYVSKTGQPIHYAGYTPDNARNKYFNLKGWVVIRFAEEQVVKDPKACCKVIAEVIETMTGDKTYSRRFKNVPVLPPIKQWTKEEAAILYQKRHRATYLKS
ncbi:MAG: hypothetical protein RL329_3372 [Bacteroidota bacterium]|jgi:hypothetical protein